MIKNNFIVISGGPGAGKSSLLHALHQRGYSCMAEAGRAIIKGRLGKGLSPRPDPASFAIEMFERDVLNFTVNRLQTIPVFFDRSLLDSASLIQEADREYFRKIKPLLHSHRFCNKVFFAAPWKAIYQNDAERDQSFETSVDIYERLLNWYRFQGYTAVILPQVSIEERADFILEELGLIS